MNPTPTYKVSSSIPHVLRVKMLYKRALKNLRAENNHINWYRYEACQLRDRFDQNKDVDPKQGHDLVRKGEYELYKWIHFAPIRHAESYLGVAHQRVVIPPDWLCDYWHPLEKAQYPDYFETRLTRKEQFLMEWEEKYSGKKYCKEEPEPPPEPECCEMPPEEPPCCDPCDPCCKSDEK